MTRRTAWLGPTDAPVSVRVLDRREHSVCYPLSPGGVRRATRLHRLVLVHVEGEAAPRWIAAERLEAPNG